jgi:flagellin-like hook-associated protein FlgL
VVAAAGGGLSEAERAALQIETDAALEAIDRIGHTTSYGGRKLLDGQGGFEVSGLNPDQVADIEVSAYAGGSGTMPPIEVLQAATPASLTYTNEAGALEEDVTLQLSGDQGTVTLEFTAGTTLQQMAAAVGATTDQTGVSASVDGDELTFTSSAVGSDAGVAVEVVEGTFDLGQTTAASGGDVVVSVDGQQFTGEGNTVRVSTAGLEAEIELAEGFIGAVDPMTVSGGGLTFLLTPDVNQTSTLALPAVSTSALGGSAGRLSELATGGGAALAGGNLGQAIEILDAAQDQVLQGRARAGAFEKYTVESSQSLLGSMEETISSALSSIRDTDVAAEASRLVRSQILVDSAFSSLMLAGQRRSLIGGLLDPS